MMSYDKFIRKNADGAWDYFDPLTENAQSWDKPEGVKKPKSIANSKGIYILKEENEVNSKIASLTRKIKTLEMENSNLDKSSKTVCGTCECDDHLTKDCPTMPVFKGILQEQANAMDPYKRLFHHKLGNLYNPN